MQTWDDELILLYYIYQTQTNFQQPVEENYQLSILIYV